MDKTLIYFDFCFVVRVEGLEPPRLAAPDPKSGASTNFATPALSRHRRVGVISKVCFRMSRAKTHESEFFFHNLNFNALPCMGLDQIWTE